MNLKNKKILLIGMGLSGNASLKLAAEKGAIFDVFDNKADPEINPKYKGQIRNLYTGGKKPDFTNCDYDFVVVSPGVPTKTGIVNEAKGKKLNVIGEIEFACQFTKGKFIGITGTNGKSTTTNWVFDVFKRAGLKAHLAGNVGIPLSDVVLKHCDKDDIYICELSSYQLESINSFKPILSAFLNITPDHLARHGNMDSYMEAKLNISKNMDKNGKFILNLDDPKLNSYYLKNKDKMQPKLIGFSKYSTDADINSINYPITMNLRGEHNLENALAVLAIAKNYGIDDKYIRESLSEFKGVEHRNEFLGIINGVGYYNDSKATNPEASIPALKSLDETIILIAGGMDKKNDYFEWINHFKNVKYVYLFGETKNDIADAMRKLGLENYKIVNDLDEAFKGASSKAIEGQVVLLSPACASWDMYKSFEKRGEHFKKLFQDLENIACNRSNNEKILT